MNKVKTGGSILLIPTEDVLAPEYISRKVVSLEELYKLADSIRNSGILNPLTVKKCKNGCYMVVSGERRRRAAEIAGCEYIPCVVMDIDENESVLYNICENIHRKELHYLELATILDELHDYMSVSDMADSLSVSEGMILSRIKLLTLPENIKWKIMTENLPESIANALVRVDSSDRQNEIVDLIISSGCSFSEAYELTEKLKKRVIFTAHYKDFRIFENTIEHAVDTMKASGIDADCRKVADDSKIIYTVTINKLI